MKRLIYLTYLGLLALLLIACEKESVAPASAMDLPEDSARKENCESYRYLQKTGIMNLGTVRSDNLLVGFDPALTLAQQQLVLAQYPIFDQIEGDVFMDSGLVTVVKLNGNATCILVQQMVASLERKPQVKFAAPVFNDPYQVFEWIGPSNEILVTLKDAAFYPQLQHLARATRTTIVLNLFDLTYILSADKRSAGNALEMTSVFNSAPFIDYADPNFIMQSPPLKAGNQPEWVPRKELLQAETAL